MPKPDSSAGGEAENKDQGQPQADAFGQSTAAETPPKAEEDGGKKEEKKFEAIPEDHPTIVGLNKQIEDIKREYGGNLSSQRDIIKTLEGKIEALTTGKGDKDEGEQADVLFKEIKRSKDLTKEEREEMTETEIRQMDQIADMQDAQNKLYAELQKKGKTEETKAVDNLNATVQGFAKELAKKEDGSDNIELANQIIEAVKQFNLAGLSEAQVKERVANAAKLVPDYKAPKEQIKKDGKPVKTGGDNADDPFGVDQIVENVGKGSDGTYAL